ncbi:hypothetical protein [Paraburkholderia bryophila]|uniref:Uncharacterized protein n=1 Tax=Paraburkholderia bryophila TaxID=420952 RepID=A0A7Z0B9D4_9BURK|nr:hypothetical protein [Paraburkholderia bryophila]NYH24665.1 hypothetical protein [Paraburkholderia bryophila]
MQSNVLPFVKPVAAVERPYRLKFKTPIDGAVVTSELAFTSDDERSAKACELVNSRVAVVFLPVNQ